METKTSPQAEMQSRSNRRELIAVCASLFLLLFGTYISGTLLVPYTASLGGTGLTIGIVYSCMYAVRLVFGTPIGRLSQRKGSKRILTYSMGLFPLIAIAYWISWNIPSLLFSRLLHGVASAMLLPMAMAYIGEASPKGQEGRYMAVYNSLLFAASALGPLVAGEIYDRYGVRTAFLVLFTLAALSFVLISTLAGGWRAKGGAADAQKPDEETDAPPAGRLLRNRKLLALGSINVGMAVLLALFGASFTQYALDRKLSMGQVGVLIATINIVIGLSQLPFGRFVDRRNKVLLTGLSGVAAAVSAACFPFVRGIVPILLVSVLSGLFLSMNLSAFSALSTIAGREAGMGGTMGFLGTANSAGTILGYLLLGFVTDLFGVDTAFWLSGLLFVLGLAAFLTLWATGRNKLQQASSTPQSR